MKILQIILFLFSFSLCYSQQITKSEFKKLIKESKKEKRESGFSYYSKIITNNKDSLFFKSDKVEIYSSEAATSEKEFCRTVEFKFLKNNKVNFIDCQNCTGPLFCYLSTDKNIYKYQIKENDSQLYIFFKNNYNEINFKIISSIENELNRRKFYKIKMERIN